MVRCWGSNEMGQIDSTTASSTDIVEPTSPVGLEEQIVFGIASGGHHACAILPDRTISCWGHNAEGACGSGVANVQDAQPVMPVDTPGGIEWYRVYGGKNHTCAADADHEVYCWGSNEFGQLGVGSSATHKYSPEQVTW